MLRTNLALVLALAAVSAQAQTIFKCTDPAGNVEYRNSACPSGTEAATLDTPLAAGTMIDIREFHDEVLKNGALPLALLERVIDAYIAHRKAA